MEATYSVLSATKKWPTSQVTTVLSTFKVLTTATIVFLGPNYHLTVMTVKSMQTKRQSPLSVAAKKMILSGCRLPNVYVLMMQKS